MWYGTFTNDPDNILAEFRSKSMAKRSLNEYVVNTYSNDIPDLVYLCYVASIDM